MSRFLNARRVKQRRFQRFVVLASRTAENDTYTRSQHDADINVIRGWKQLRATKSCVDDTTDDKLFWQWNAWNNRFLLTKSRATQTETNEPNRTKWNKMKKAWIDLIRDEQTRINAERKIASIRRFTNREWRKWRDRSRHKDRFRRLRRIANRCYCQYRSYYMRKTLNHLPRISGESNCNCTCRFHVDPDEPENAGKACYRAERG